MTAGERTSFVTNLGGKLGQVEYVLTADEIVQRSSASSRRMALADVVSVVMATFAGIATCTLRASSGKEICISRGEPPATEEYRRFVTALHGRLRAAGGRVAYERGAWFLAAVYAGIALLLVAVAFGLPLLIEVPARYETRLMLARVLAAIWVLVLPLIVNAVRPRPYDPANLPDRVFK